MRIGAALVAVVLFAASGCSNLQDDSIQQPAGTDGLETIEREDWSDFFEAEGVSGTFVLHKLATDSVQVFDVRRAGERRTPASTFKILHSLIILETAVMSDVDTVIPWDGVDRGSVGWNRDHSVRSAIDVSAVWVYQELARRVGADRMKQWVSAADYGNEDIGGPIDSFWLDGDLRISALEQVDFLARFASGELPFGERAQNSVREILVQESGTNWSWSYKTGLSAEADPDLGWLVGMVDLESATWVFALNVDLGSQGQGPDPSVRLMVSRTILETEGVLPTD